MEFTTKTEISKSQHQIDFNDKVLLLGSCFTENIGNILHANYFSAKTNPVGTVYNPVSVANTIINILNNKKYSAEDLFFNAGQYHSFDFHSRYSAGEQDMTLAKMNESIASANEFLEKTNYLIITFGTAWVYEKNDSIVSNCHKLPEKSFTRRRLAVKEIVDIWSDIIEKILKINPSIRFIFTVSPIRHIKDTLHGNQISKATLLLSIDEIQHKYSHCVSYFPAYEILIDELRDYRFYDEDMTHPSKTAIAYIYEKFAEAFFSQETKRHVDFCQKINKALNHRPLNPESEKHKEFLRHNIDCVRQYIEKHKLHALEKAVEEFKNKL